MEWVDLWDRLKLQTPPMKTKQGKARDSHKSDR